MAGYLDQYGAGEERRNQILIRAIIAVVVLAVGGTLIWYLMLNHHQESVVKNFIAALKQGDTQSAYRIWGCASEQACPDYNYQKFLQDWGPGPNGPDPAVIKLTDSEACNNAVMLTVQVNRTRTEDIWLERSNDTMGFAPFPICPQQIPYEIMAHRTVGKLRKILF
jgi:hypothetical protein